jgi:hypothetical protein
VTHPTSGTTTSSSRPPLDADAIREIVHGNVNVVTPLTGATIKPGPMVTVPPSAEVTDDDLAPFGADSGLNAAFLADQFSAFIAHERDSANLLRSLAAISSNPALQATYKKFAGEAEEAAQIWADCILDLGGNPQYASPAGRMTEMMDGKLQEAMLGAGSADPMTMELAGMKTAMVGAHLCVVNVDLLDQFAEAANGPAADVMRQASARLRPLAEKHHQSSMETIATMSVQQAKHPLVQKMGQAAEKLTDKVKGVLHHD